MRAKKNQGLRFGSVVAALIRLAIVGAVIAAIVLMLQRPDLPPAPEATGGGTPGALVSALSNARSNTESGTMTEIPWSIVNGVLADTMKSATVEGMQFLPIKIERCYIQGTDADSEIIVERSLFGMSLVSRVVIAPEKTASGYTLAVKDGAIGRLPLPGKFVVMIDSAIKQLPMPFSQELDILSRANVIEISPESLVVGFGPR
jgi:hypothetical protein